MTITRSEVLRRAQSIWPYGSVPYSQSEIHRPDGYRQDCSGYVSMCWAIPLNVPGSWGGLNTVSLVTNGWMYEIQPDDLKLGDAIGKCGPGTAGDAGHVQIFVAWLNQDPNDSHYYCLEQAGGGSGPKKRLHDWPAGYKAYRFKGIVDDAAAPTPAPLPYVPALRRAWPSYMPSGHYFGLITGPNESHGGYYWNERQDVKAIQQRLIVLGYAFWEGVKITDPNSWWADAKFGQSTKDAVTRWQRVKRPYPLTTLPGQVWSDDWRDLFTY